MKILILHDEKELKLPGILFKLLEEKSIDTEIKSLGTNWYREDSFLDMLTAYSHFIVVNTVDPESSWGSLCLGYAFGIKSPLVILGTLPSYFQKNTSGDFKIIKKEREFADFLNGEFQEWIVKDKQKQAKNDLLDLGIPYNEESFERCILDRNSRAVELFLQAGFSPDAMDKNGVPLLSLAARTGDPNTARILLQAGARINQQSKDRGSSALMDACTGKALDIVKDLLAAGADVNLKSKDGQSALVIAVGLNNLEIAEELLKSGADADDPDALGASARKYATLFNKPGMVALFNTYAPLKAAVVTAES